MLITAAPIPPRTKPAPAPTAMRLAKEALPTLGLEPPNEAVMLVWRAVFCSVGCEGSGAWKAGATVGCSPLSASREGY